MKAKKIATKKVSDDFGDTIIIKISNLDIKVDGLPFKIIGDADIKGNPNNFKLAGISTDRGEFFK